MGINERMVESRENIADHEGTAVICWLKEERSSEPQKIQNGDPAIVKQFGDSVRIINEYIEKPGAEKAVLR